MEKQGATSKAELRITGCRGFCESGPHVVIQPEGILYQRVKAEDVAEIVAETIINGNIVDRLLFVDPKTGEKFVHEKEVPFYKKQKRILLDNNAMISPDSIEDFIAQGGYAALSMALKDMSPEAVIEEVKQAGLRGRGGGGFLTARKWETTHNTESDRKYVICNCDEGDPGAFMDRSLMEGNPHSVIEGMIIGAYAIGAHENTVFWGRIYLVRDLILPSR